MKALSGADSSVSKGKKASVQSFALESVEVQVRPNQGYQGIEHSSGSQGATQTERLKKM